MAEGKAVKSRIGLVLGLGVPTVLVLALQFLLRYRLQTELGVSVAWAPLYVIGMYVPADAASLLSRLIASVL